MVIALSSPEFCMYIVNIQKIMKKIYSYHLDMEIYCNSSFCYLPLYFNRLSEQDQDGLIYIRCMVYGYGYKLCVKWL